MVSLLGATSTENAASLGYAVSRNVCGYFRLQSLMQQNVFRSEKLLMNWSSFRRVSSTYHELVRKEIIVSYRMSGRTFFFRFIAQRRLDF